MYFLYPLLKPLLFQIEPEKSHKWVLNSLRNFAFIFPKKKIPPGCQTSLLGFTVRSPIFLAAGFDKEGLYFPYLAKLGFGGIEVGTFTLKPQMGNPHPRLFRLPWEKALLNRMGFNNPGIYRGIQNILQNLSKVPEDFLLGISIGKGKDTPLEDAFYEYNEMLKLIEQNFLKKNLYVAINISSPNTKNLKNLQSPALLKKFLAKLKRITFPLVIKLSHDFTSFEELAEVLFVIEKAKISGVILTNTSQDFSLLQNIPAKLKEISGGISGEPLKEKSRAFLEAASKGFPNLTVISSGGVMDPSEIIFRLQIGAKAVQVYTGLVYYGPHLPMQGNQLLSRFRS